MNDCWLAIDGVSSSMKRTATWLSVTINLCTGLSRFGLGREPKGAMDKPDAGETKRVPIELQTQFFKSSDTQAKLAVLTRVDMNAIRFRKDAGRSKDNITFATAIFDENGNFITGGEKILEMKLLDPPRFQPSFRAPC